LPNCFFINYSWQFNPEEERVVAFLVEAEEELRNANEQFQFIDWAYSTNITDENEKKKTEFQVCYELKNY
jgi:hypothetical protein